MFLFPFDQQATLQQSPLRRRAFENLFFKYLNRGLILQPKPLFMNFPDNLRYTKDHEWVRIEGDEAIIGITDFAQRELGDIVYVEVETAGQALEAGAVFGTVEAVKTVSDLYLPLSGTITEVNPNLNSNPELVNSDPYGEGWMVKMKLDNPGDVDTLMDAPAYQDLVA